MAPPLRIGDLRARRGDLRLGRRRSEIGPLLAGKGGRRSAEERDDLAAHVDARIIVDAQLRRDDAAPGEHHRGGDDGVRARRIGGGNVILAEDQRLRRAPRPGPDHRTLVRRLVGDQRHALQIAAVVAGGAQARGIELRGDILRGDVEFGAARLAPLHRVGREEQDMRLHRRLIGGQGCRQQRVGRRRIARRWGWSDGRFGGLRRRGLRNGVGERGRGERQRGEHARDTDHATEGPDVEMRQRTSAAVPRKPPIAAGRNE